MSLLSRNLVRGARGALAAAVVLLQSGARAQEIQLPGDLSSTASVHRQRVALSTESLRVKAGHAEWVELRFQVDPGLHINSHAPHDELLVPTSLSLDPASPLKWAAQRYPPGIPLRLEAGAGETLSTYQGEFRVALQVAAPRGVSALSGTLRYQACDARACFPPRSLPVRVVVTAE